MSASCQRAGVKKIDSTISTKSSGTLSTSLDDGVDHVVDPPP